ncbi:6-phosphogluconolactonase [Borreliella spielmanii]|uniref:6-phosphogluconolactonase n=1 Tax=Borreliella spielmanii A14S TaxID=498742 RepID=C0APR6_9SPIR|nr:6-phosphogluconolactonase [Borreliella spielmanii]EEF84610.1 6-phosphogluconolactonase [Borreliella spielmanii A14S]WKC83314.1 6-phosphogluconolactonase [Borreliella spielmanii]
MEFLYSDEENNLKNRFFDFFNMNIDQDKYTSIGICGGRSIITFLSVFLKQNFSFKRSHFFLVDERCVPLNNENSNYNLLSKNFFSKMVDKNLISISKFHAFVYNETDETTSIHDYNIEFNSRFNIFDFILVSVGEDGHIASLFPSRKLLFSDVEGYQYEYNSPKFPTKRISLTPKSLFNAKAVVLLFMGLDKKCALEKFLGFNSSINECPARLLKEHPNLLVLTNIKRDKSYEGS